MAISIGSFRSGSGWGRSRDISGCIVLGSSWVLRSRATVLIALFRPISYVQVRMNVEVWVFRASDPGTLAVVFGFWV